MSTKVDLTDKPITYLDQDSGVMPVRIRTILRPHKRTSRRRVMELTDEDGKVIHVGIEYVGSIVEAMKAIAKSEL